MKCKRYEFDKRVVRERERVLRVMYIVREKIPFDLTGRESFRRLEEAIPALMLFR